MQRTDAELMEALKHADAAALEELYHRHAAGAATYFHRQCWDRHRADDLVQELFLRLWKSAHLYRAGAKVTTYLYAIAHNLWVNEIRRTRPQALTPEDDVAAPADEPVRADEIRALRRAFAALPEGDREILTLSEYQELPYGEIAEILAIPEGTVKSRVFHALRRLKERMGITSDNPSSPRRLG